MHYYQFNIGDYASHTRHLTLIEDLAYRRLLDVYYLHEKPLDSDVQKVARIVGMREYQLEVETILNEFFEFINTDGCSGWINRRADEEIAQYKAKIEQASRAGKASAQRKNNVRSTDVQRTFNDRSTDVQLNIKQEPLTNNHNISITHTVHNSQQSREPNAAASVCLAIKKIGIIDINPSHPELLMLIDAGSTIDEFMHAARTAKDRNKGFAYVLGIVKGQRSDAAHEAENGVSSRKARRVTNKQGLMIAAGQSLFAHRDEDKNENEREIDGTAKFVESGSVEQIAGVMDK